MRQDSLSRLFRIMGSKLTYKTKAIGAVTLGVGVLGVLLSLAVSSLPASMDTAKIEGRCLKVDNDLRQLIVESNTASRLLDSRIEQLSFELSDCLGESNVKLGAPIIERSHCLRARPHLEELRVEVESLGRKVRELALVKYYRFDDLRRCYRGRIFL